VLPKAGGPTGAPRSHDYYDFDNHYGFDQDFRLYSVLGPFMGPARIKDVWHSGKIRSAYTSNFPGILTTNARVGYGQNIITREDMQNNALFHTAPVVGTSYARTMDRTTQFHTYADSETDSIISFCNPLQSDLNNAPGAVLHNEISDDPVSGPSARFPGTVMDVPPVSSVTGFASSNGNERDAPSQWTVPRRHHICRKQVCMYVCVCVYIYIYIYIEHIYSMCIYSISGTHRRSGLCRGGII
jgi:hypothetical protein